MRRDRKAAAAVLAPNPTTYSSKRHSGAAGACRPPVDHRWRAALPPAGTGLGLAVMVFFGAIITGSRKAIVVTGVLMLPFLVVVIIATIVVA
ncbi:hypothetical protein Psi01_33960 [Planobispora siamensis]|uniref:Uncharacterized protein n=1 Tax=Planobispora siamensis TaxID=936338 RepID=A0A8J3SHP1_9ACTN|nr:hypothetical protein Psi01_33960 [Planobispora siamensis]